ncbi:uncharacterized protein LOC131151397 [Malania oleifera]|uniref:uncharacterized protein LOC131151397 n=1 Tax=Malania oleifera TaxID=397392 RepID=UPI0025AE9DD1|nr:uncharacterized protein LOC131151397 [Malania oleifera]
MGMMKMSWYNSGSGGSRRSIRLGRSTSTSQCGGEAGEPRWRTLWRRIKWEKKKIFSSKSSWDTMDCSKQKQQQQGFYDEEEYLQNFDQGLGWAEPDNLPRSFSARFANPSRRRVFTRTG